MTQLEWDTFSMPIASNGEKGPTVKTFSIIKKKEKDTPDELNLRNNDKSDG